MRKSLTERDITRIIKNVISENRGAQSLDGERDELRSVSQRLLRSMDDYSSLVRKGEYKRMGDELDNIRKVVRKLKDVTEKIDSKVNPR
jgi:predicted translin family RNA/ssDNA-binding protein